MEPNPEAMPATSYDLQKNCEEQRIPTTPGRIIDESAELKLVERQQQEESDGNTQAASVDTNSSSDGGLGVISAHNNEHAPQSDGVPSLPSPLPPLPVQQIPLICLHAGLSRKASPSHLKSWIALSLTLDGRDKLTKVLQYGSRLLAWYYETVASSIGGSLLTNDATATQLLGNAQRLRGLQAKLTESRKAYRLGRSFVEMDKIRGMGWGKFLAYHLKHSVVSNGNEGGEKTTETIFIEQSDRRASNVGWGLTTTIPAAGAITTTQELNSSNHALNGLQRGDDKAPRLLLRRASTNIGWGPATTSTTASETAAVTTTRSASFYRSVSNLGRRMYRPLASQLVASYGDNSSAAPPAWQIVGSTLKILGLMGFWMGDNINFVGSSGLFDDISLPSEERAKVRAALRRKAGHFAGRAYFMGAISGLYVSFRQVLMHRAGPLREAIDLVNSLDQKQNQRSVEKSSKSWGVDRDHDNEEEYDDNVDPQLASARSDLEKIKGKQFVLFLSLLKVSNDRVCLYGDVAHCISLPRESIVSTNVWFL